MSGQSKKWEEEWEQRRSLCALSSSSLEKGDIFILALSNEWHRESRHNYLAFCTISGQSLHQPITCFQLTKSIEQPGLREKGKRRSFRFYLGLTAKTSIGTVYMLHRPLDWSIAPKHRQEQSWGPTWSRWLPLLYMAQNASLPARLIRLSALLS